MRRFEVWAPAAEGVELVLGGERREPMRECGGGWFETHADASVGDRYGFSLDGGPARPDPRSRFQPDGVHALSAVVGDELFSWEHAGFRAPPVASAVIYELHVGTFTPEGTLDAAADRLDHLVELGVTHVELLPLNAFPGERGWGYDGVCWFAPHAAYTGPDGPAAVKRFVDACHGRGLAVVLDVVYNHLGPSGNYLGEFGPYFSDAYNTPWGPAVNLDGSGSDEVRRYICDNALMWLGEYRFDALRLDAVHAFFDRGAEHLLEQMSRETASLASRVGRPLALIAESDLNDPRVVTPRAAGGLGCDAQWSDDFHHALHTLVTGERDGYYADFGSVGQLATALERAFVYAGEFAPERGRRHGRVPARGTPAGCFLAYIQNHDQIGNRAAGDRISETAAGEALRTAAALVLLGPFTPMLFQGEEWDASAPFRYFTDHEEEGLARAVREGRRAEFASFGWKPEDVPDPQARETFERSKLDWSEPGREPHAAALAWRRELIALRRSDAGVAGNELGAVRVAFEERDAAGAGGTLVMRNGGVVVACSFGGANREVGLSGVLDGGERAEPLLASGEGLVVEGRAARVGGFGCAIGRVRPLG